MSGCDSTRPRLSAYLDDEVPSPERRAIEDHLAGCASCAKLREELARATQVLASSPEPHWNPGSTDALIGNLRAKLARERPISRSLSVPPPQPAGYSWRALAIPLAAVFLIVAVPGLWIGAHRPEPAAERTTAHASAQLAQAPKPAAKTRADAPAETKSALAKQESQARQIAAPVAAPDPQLANAAPLSGANELARPPAEAGALSRDAGAVAGKPTPTLASATQRAGPAAPQASSLKPQAFVLTPGIDLELADLERRMAAVETAVSSFTTAAREQARRESSQVASRRFATWR